MEPKYNQLANDIIRNASSHVKRRYLVAIAGVPGSGKTTTAHAVALQINSINSATKATVMSMDGFHLDRATLDQLPNREEAYVRRGAPWTFDIARLVSFLRQLRIWADSDAAELGGGKVEALSAPSFDHETKDPIENAVPIADETRILIIEGNYLLLDEPEWRELAHLVDYRVFVKANLHLARERLAKRHVKSGIEKSLVDAFRRVDSNDYLNSLRVQESLVEPNVVILSI